jgi:hypothetical protein
MPRTWVPLSVAAVVLLGALFAGRAVNTTAQDATPAAPAGHPFAGAWLVDTDAADPANFPALAVAGADGTYVESHPQVGVGVGAWVPTGERTATLTVVFRATDQAGAPAGVVAAQAEVAVDAAGDGWTSDYAFEATAPDGSVLFAGRATARATRLVAGAAPPLGAVFAGTPAAATPAP